VDWIKKKQFARVISLSGINTNEKNIDSVIYGIAANKGSLKLLQGHGLQIIQDGITTGVTAMMLLELKRTNIEAVSLLGNVQLGADYHAAAEVLKKLAEILELKIDIEPLLVEAKQLEKDIINQLQNVKETKDSVEKFESPASMYA
ncbi:MAG: PAC2 family protein, partial [archaeon]